MSGCWIGIPEEALLATVIARTSIKTCHRDFLVLGYGRNQMDPTKAQNHVPMVLFRAQADCNTWVSCSVWEKGL